MRYFTWKLEFVSDILWVTVGQKHTEDSLSTNPETYSGRLTEWSTDLGTKTLALKKQFSGFLFSVVLPQKKIRYCRDQWSIKESVCESVFIHLNT